MICFKCSNGKIGKMYFLREQMEWYGCIYGPHKSINVTVGEWEVVSSKNAKKWNSVKIRD